MVEFFTVFPSLMPEKPLLSIEMMKKSPKPHKTVNITLDSYLNTGEEGLIFYKSGPNTKPLENGTMKTFLS